MPEQARAKASAAGKDSSEPAHKETGILPVAANLLRGKAQLGPHNLFFPGTEGHGLFIDRTSICFRYVSSNNKWGNTTVTFFLVF